MPGLAAAREFVTLAREADHHRVDVAIFQRAKEDFAAGSWWGAIVGFAENEHHRCLDLRNVGERRVLFELLGLLKRRTLEPSRLKEGEIGGVPPVGPVGDIALRDRGLEAVRLSYGPV